MTGAGAARRLRPALFLVLLIWFGGLSIGQSTQRTPAAELYAAAFGAERLLEWGENDLSREQIRGRRIELEAALDRVLKNDPRYFDRDGSNYSPAVVNRLLGQLALFEGQFAESERRFGRAIELGPAYRLTAEDLADLARARATALALDGRLDAAATLAAATPCAPGRRCAPASLGSTCRQIGARAITIDWGILTIGPRGLCVASAFEQSAAIAEAQSRPDLVEPFLRLSISATRKLRFVNQANAGQVRWEAMLRLFNWYSARNRDADASVLVRESQADVELATAGGQLFRSLQRQVPATPAIETAARENPAQKAAELDRSIAANERMLGQIMSGLAPMPPWRGGGMHAGTYKLASEIYRSLALQYRDKKQYAKALENNRLALYYVPGFVAPGAPVRLDLGPAGPSCPPARATTPECTAWDTDALAQYANVYLAELLQERALLEEEAGNGREALLVDRLGQRVLQNWLSRNWSTPTEVIETLAERRSLDRQRLEMLARLAAPGRAEAEGAKAQAFEALQLFQFNRVEAAVRSAVARGAAGSPQQQLVLQRRQRLQEDRIRFRSDPAQVERIAGEIARLEAQLPFSASEFERRTTFAPLPLAAARAALKPDEALLLIAQLDDRVEAMAVTAQGVRWVTVAVSADWMRSEVGKLRRHLDRSGADPVGFDRQAAFGLYSRMIAPLGDLLGRRLVFVSANGPLAELPLSVLVTRAPSGSNTDPAALRATGWMFQRNVLVSLPSIAALKSLKMRMPVTRRDALIGVGDPPGEAGVQDQEERAGEGVELKFAAQELARLAESRRGPVKLLTRENGTEAMLRATDLRSTAILAFATHAVPGGTERHPEPGLILARRSAGALRSDDDGFLSASEVALLPVGADVVVLSACSTAAADARGGEVLSGLALSFLYAGGQSVMVTHWPVVDSAAAHLVTGALASPEVRGPQDIARALNREMEQLMLSNQDPRFADPRIWAPFAVVGG